MAKAKQAKTVQVPMNDLLRTQLDAARASQKARVGHNVPRYAVARDAVEVGLVVVKLAGDVCDTQRLIEVLAKTDIKALVKAAA